MIQPSTLKFLKDLRRNNNKPWFDNNRGAYDAAKQDFESFISSVISSLGKKDEQVAELKGKECIFRINRDIRFSNDKTPYKTNMGASIKRGGKKSVYAGYYLHIEPGKSFVGGGIWMPDPGSTKKVRQEISYCFPEFKSILSSKKFNSVYGELFRDKEVSLVNIPKGYEKDDPASDYLKLKSWLATKDLKDAELTTKEFIKTVMDAFLALQPLLQFINRSLEE